MAAGLALVGYGIYVGVLQVDSINSQLASTEGTVQSTAVSGSEVITSGGRTDVEYVPSVTYDYTVGGRSYTGERIYHGLDREQEGRHFESAPEARRVLEGYEPGSTVTVYYFPEDPGRAILVKPDVQLVAIFALGFVALFPIGIGAGLELWVRKSRSEE